jgi:Raf kinase inhibitor-like YbhB/YbcL family protein
MGVYWMVIKIKSTVFEEGEPIPQKYTCDGVNVSPPLQWGSVPTDVKSIALICEDPDAPSGIWSHWVIFNLPGETTDLSEFIMEREELENGAQQGLNDSGTIGYRGPCPPSVTHRYYFKIYALDVKLNLPSRITRSDLLKAMDGHIIDQGQIGGTYTR